MTVQLLKSKLLEKNIIEDNAWLTKYCEIILNNLETVKEKNKTQSHHFIPVAYYKDFYKSKTREQTNYYIKKDSNNFCVNLSLKDHIIAHCYLSLAAKTNSTFHYKMFCAVIKCLGSIKAKDEFEAIKFLESSEYKTCLEFGKHAISTNIPKERISKTLHEYRTEFGFSDEHKQKIKEAREKRRVERSKIGLNFYDHPEHFATRSKPVYCILDTGERFDFESILEAGKWWYETFKPFGDSYSVPTFQRKIEKSIVGEQITFGNKLTKNYIIVNNIRWFYV